MSILFLGGYLFIDLDINNYIINGLINSLVLGVKSSFFVFSFVWVRASFPRVRFDQLMLFCWTVLLPIVIALDVLIPCIMFSFNLL